VVGSSSLEHTEDEDTSTNDRLANSSNDDETRRMLRTPRVMVCPISVALWALIGCWQYLHRNLCKDHKVSVLMLA
jgi:hypothetical protein